MLAKQLQKNSGEFLLKIKECLRKGLNIKNERISEEVLDYTNLKQIIYLHYTNEVYEKQ